MIKKKGKGRRKKKRKKTETHKQNPECSVALNIDTTSDIKPYKEISAPTFNSKLK